MITVTLFCRKMSYVAIYALSGKKIIRQKFACVNFLTNIMSVTCIKFQQGIVSQSVSFRDSDPRYTWVQ